MKQYLLDTNICAFLLRGKYDIATPLLEVGISNCHISIITYAELYYGAMYSNNPPKHLKELETMVSSIDVIPIDDIIPCFAKEKARLRKAGTPIDDFDLLIGSTAKTYGMTLVTENVKHLNRIEGINIENWVKR